MEIIVSPKSLERQIKILEERILELQSEMGSLEKKREACHVLLGIPVAPVTANSGELAAAPAKKAIARKKRDAELAEVSEDDAALDLPSSAEQEPVAHSGH